MVFETEMLKDRPEFRELGEIRMIEAVKTGDSESVAKLLDQNIEKYRGEMTMMMFAAIKNNHASLLPLLISIDEDINQPFFGQTPLMTAARKNDLKAVNF